MYASMQCAVSRGVQTSRRQCLRRTRSGTVQWAVIAARLVRARASVQFVTGDAHTAHRNISQCALEQLPLLHSPLLQYLDVSHNALQSGDLENWSLPALLRLDASSNALVRLPWAVLRGSPLLSELWLDSNSIRLVIPVRLIRPWRSWAWAATATWAEVRARGTRSASCRASASCNRCRYGAVLFGQLTLSMARHPSARCPRCRRWTSDVSVLVNCSKLTGRCLLASRRSASTAIPGCSGATPSWSQECRATVPASWWTQRRSLSAPRGLFPRGPLLTWPSIPPSSVCSGAPVRLTTSGRSPFAAA